MFIVHGTLSVAPTQTLALRFATFASLQVVFSAVLVGSLWWEGHVGGVTLPPHEAIEWVGWKQPYRPVPVGARALHGAGFRGAVHGAAGQGPGHRAGLARCASPFSAARVGKSRGGCRLWRGDGGGVCGGRTVILRSSSLQSTAEREAFWINWIDHCRFSVRAGSAVWYKSIAELMYQLNR
jgi:hypothetical protein